MRLKAFQTSTLNQEIEIKEDEKFNWIVTIIVDYDQKVLKNGEVLYLLASISDFTGVDNNWIEHMRFELQICKYIVYFVFSSIMYYPSGRKFSFEFHLCFLAIGKFIKFIFRLLIYC